MAATSFSSCIERAPRTPTRGCEDRVMLQLLSLCRYVRAGILCRERYFETYFKVLSDILVGTTKTEG